MRVMADPAVFKVRQNYASVKDRRPAQKHNAETSWMSKPDLGETNGSDNLVVGSHRCLNNMSSAVHYNQSNTG